MYLLLFGNGQLSNVAVQTNKQANFKIYLSYGDELTNMSKQESIKLETETSAYKTIQAWKDQATKAGLVLKAGAMGEDGDFPRRPWDSLKQFRRNVSITKDHKRIITTIARQLVTLKDEKNKPTKKEFLTFAGYYRGRTHKGEEYDANFQVGKYQRPKILSNPSLTYDQRTGAPKGPEKILGNQETIYDLEIPKSKEGRKKLIDSILGEDNHPDNVLYYIRHLDQNNHEQSRDNTLTYDEFVNLSIEDLIDISQRGAGGKSSQYYKDKEGQLRYKKTDAPVTSTTNKAVYQ